MKDFDTELFSNLKDFVLDGSKLDKYYIPTRYPNGLPDLIPDMAYFDDDAVTAIGLAEKLIERVRALFV